MLSQFLKVSPKDIGQIGGGKRKPTGEIDVAMIQSLNQKTIEDDIVSQYGHLIVDECHHISAVSFEQVVRQCKARYINITTRLHITTRLRVLLRDFKV